MCRIDNLYQRLLSAISKKVPPTRGVTLGFGLNSICSQRSFVNFKVERYLYEEYHEDCVYFLKNILFIYLFIFLAALGLSCGMWDLS